jgi:hypothetical protein
VVAIDLENNDGARGFFRDILIGGVVCEVSAGEIHAGNGPQREEGRVVRGQWRKRPRCTLGLTRSASSRRVTIYTALHLLVFSRLLVWERHANRFDIRTWKRIASRVSAAKCD